MNENERPLIDLAREKAESALRDNVAQHPDYAEYYIAGYEDGQKHPVQDDTGYLAAATLDVLLQEANKEKMNLRARIAELEAELAKWEQSRHTCRY